MEWNDAFNMIAAVAGAASAYAAFRAIARNDKNHETLRREQEVAVEDERLVSIAVLTLERAYSALQGGHIPGSLPPQSRVNWLTAARLIERYKLIKSRILSEKIQAVCESHEEHWRHQFYVLIRPLGNEQPDYFQPIRNDMDRTIQHTSAIIVSAFAMWPEGKTDPLDTYENIEHAAQQLGIHPLWRNLQTAIGRH